LAPRHPSSPKGLGFERLIVRLDINISAPQIWPHLFCPKLKDI